MTNISKVSTFSSLSLTPFSFNVSDVNEGTSPAESEFGPYTDNMTSPPHNNERTVAHIVMETVTLSLMWLGAVFGNLLVCLVIYRSRRLQSTTNYFVVSLSGVDLILAVACMPFILGRVISTQWLFGSVMCKIVRFLQLFVPGATMFILLSICIDRFYTIIYPLSFKITRGRAKRMVITGSVFAAIFASPSFYFYDVMELAGKPFCMTYIMNTPHGIVYIIVFAILIYILPIIGIGTGYSRVFKYIWRSGVGGRTFQRTTNPVPRAKVKMVKMIVIINIIVCILYGPFIVTQVLYCITATKNLTAYIIVVWVLFSSSMAKPLIYLCYNSNFRRGCKEVFCMSTMKCYRTSAYTITTASAFGKNNYVGVVDYGREHRRLDSPSKTFDRSAMLDKSIWPLTNQTPSTYL